MKPQIENKIIYYVLIVGLLIGVLITLEMIMQVGTVGGIGVALLPVFVLLGFAFVLRPYATLWLYFVVNYYLMGLSRYVELKPGMIMMGFTILLLVVVLLSQTVRKVRWNRGINVLTLFWGIWFLYCLILSFLPGSNFEAWLISANAVGFIPFLLVLLVPIIFQRYRDLKRVLFVLALFTLTAVAKALWQEYMGFDVAEKIFLYREGGASTHIIWSGIRYFSFFSDASAFGSAMAFAMVVFSLAAITLRGKWRVFYLFVAVAALYSFGIAGTRSAMIIPFAGYAMYILVIRKWSILLTGAMILIAVFLFFRYTHIGSGNATIYRMRLAFNPTEDASFQVRLKNQKQLWGLMVDKPFGVGLGMGGGKAKRFDSKAATSHIATDSWYVLLWVETGIFGLSLYLLLQLLILGFGAWLVMFKIQHPELRGLLRALLAGTTGMLAGCYANEILNYPNGVILYTCQAMIFAGYWYDKELTQKESAP